jgi:endo-1,4-beta-mannosidase
MVGVYKGIAQSPQRQQLKKSSVRDEINICKGNDELSLVAITVYRMNDCVRMMTEKENELFSKVRLGNVTVWPV